LLVPQREHVRSGGLGGENSNCGAAGRIGGWLGREGVAPLLAAANAGGGGKKGEAGGSGVGAFTGASPRGGVGAATADAPSLRRFPQS